MDKKVFYDRDGVRVRVSSFSDAKELKDSLKKSDVEEIWVSYHLKPKEALEMSIATSLFSLTVEDYGNPIAIFGICPDSVLGTKATIWMLASDMLEKRRLRFLKHSRKFIEMMLGFYPYLYNYVDERNKSSINWLKFCGANIQDPQPYGVEQMPFRYFYFERNK